MKSLDRLKQIRICHRRITNQEDEDNSLSSEIMYIHRMQLMATFTKYVQMLRASGIGAIANILDTIIEIGTQTPDDLCNNEDVELLCQEIDEVYPDANE
jgi:hypothetical protein